MYGPLLKSRIIYFILKTRYRYIFLFKLLYKFFLAGAGGWCRIHGSEPELVKIGPAPQYGTGYGYVEPLYKNYKILLVLCIVNDKIVN